MKSLDRGHHFPTAIISCAVRRYFRSQLSLQDVKEPPFALGAVVSYETVRRLCAKFGAGCARRVKACRHGSRTTLHLDGELVPLLAEP